MCGRCGQEDVDIVEVAAEVSVLEKLLLLLTHYFCLFPVEAGYFEIVDDSSTYGEVSLPFSLHRSTVSSGILLQIIKCSDEAQDSYVFKFQASVWSEVVKAACGRQVAKSLERRRSTSTTSSRPLPVNYNR